jgi:hypothetical protein
MSLLSDSAQSIPVEWSLRHDQDEVRPSPKIGSPPGFSQVALRRHKAAPGPSRARYPPSRDDVSDRPD